MIDYEHLDQIALRIPWDIDLASLRNITRLSNETEAYVLQQGIFEDEKAYYEFLALYYGSSRCLVKSGYFISVTD